MSRIFFLGFFILSACSAPIKQSSGSFRKGLEAVHNADLVEARLNLEGLKVSDPQFIEGLSEIQKINYRQGRWDRFFGQSFYYRNALLKNPISQYFNQRLLVLEVLALARHCRFREASQVAKWGLDLGRRLGNQPVNELKRSIDLFAFNSSVPERNKKKPISKKGKFHQDLAWSMSDKQLASLTTPKNLRMKVKSHCL